MASLNCRLPSWVLNVEIAFALKFLMRHEMRVKFNGTISFNNQISSSSWINYQLWICKFAPDCFNLLLQDLNLIFKGTREAPTRSSHEKLTWCKWTFHRWELERPKSDWQDVALSHFLGSIPSLIEKWLAEEIISMTDKREKRKTNQWRRKVWQRCWGGRQKRLSSDIKLISNFFLSGFPLTKTIVFVFFISFFVINFFSLIFFCYSLRPCLRLSFLLAICSSRNQ